MVLISASLRDRGGFRISVKGGGGRFFALSAKKNVAT